MEHTYNAGTQEASLSAQACLSVLSEKFASRGLSRAALAEAEEQIRAEEETRALDPLSYRLSLLSDATVRGLYRRGKDHMSGEDLLRYIQERRQIELPQKDFAACPSIYETATATALEPLPETKPEKRGLAGLPALCRELPAKTFKTLRQKLPLWFNNRPSDTSGESRKFPLSAFAAIAAIAVSLMLIVASALMVTQAETKISRLNSEISSLTGQIGELESDLESKSDLFAIRQIAVEEYGMVERDYLRMEYIELASDADVEIYEGKESQKVGLSALLSAIGLK